MATQAEKDQILKVVAGLFNGSPGGAILNDLSDAVGSGLPVHELAAILADLDLFKEIVPDTATTEQKVETLLNNFGLEPGGEEGSAAALAEEYFTARIEEGANLGHIVYEAVVYLEQEDLPEEFEEYAALLNNKLLVASVHAENYEFIDDVATGQSLFEGVTSEGPSTEEEALAHIIDIIGEPEDPEEPVDPPSDLAEALAALQAAQDARTDFLEEAAENESVAAVLPDNPTTEQIVDAIGTALTNTRTDVADDHLATLLDVSAATTFKNTNTSAATQASLIADGRAAAQSNINDAQAEVTAYNAEIAKVSGLASAISHAKTTAANLKTAQDTFDDTGAEFIGAEATFEARNTDAGPLDNDADIQFQKADDSSWGPADGLSTLAKIVDVGNTKVLFTYDTGGLKAETGLGDYSGLPAFQTSVQALINSTAALETAQTADTNADTALTAISDLSAGVFDDGETNGSHVFTQLTNREDAVKNEQDALQGFEDAIAAWEAVTELKAGLDEQDAAVTAARKVLTDPEDEDGFGIDNLIDLDGNKAGVDDDAELFLFVGPVDPDPAQNVAEITNFGEDDLVFFGSNYTFVELTEDQSIGDRVGNASTLEIFWQVDGGNVNLYVEQDAVSGSALGTDEITTVTLVGVTDVAFEGGFVSIAAAA